MEQKENHNQPGGGLYASLRRLRAQGKRLSVAETPSSHKRFPWNEATSNTIPETNEEGSPIEKKLFTRRRLPLVPIAEDRNALPELGKGADVLGTQSAKKQHPSESNLRIRRALQRRSFVSSFANTDSLSPKIPNGPASQDNKDEKTDIGISPAAYSLGGNQDGNSARKPQESFAQSLGITFESRLAGRRRRSRLLWLEENSQTKARDEDNEYCHQSTNEKQVERIVENEEKTNWSSSLLTQSRIKMYNQEGAACGNKSESETHVLGTERGHASVRSATVAQATSSRIPAADEDVTLNEGGSPVEKKLFTRRRFPLVPIAEDRNALPESGKRVGVLGTQSAKKQYPSESNLRIRRALQRRSCVPSIMNTESLSPENANGPASQENKVKKRNVGISPAAYSSGGNQDGNSARKPQESFAQSLGITFESRLAGKRRKSRLLWQEEGSQTKTRDEDNEFCLRSTNEKQDERIAENEEKTNWSSSLLTQSRVKMDNQQEAAYGNKRESATHIFDTERGRASVRRRRSIYDIVRQNALAPQAPAEEPAASKQGRVSPLRHMQGNSMKRRRSVRQTPYGSSGTNAKRRDLQLTDLARLEESQECRRMLQFESDNMNDGGKELTSPLIMMAQTPIISRASVLQNPVDQKQLKEVCEPVIKKSLFHHNMKTTRFRRWSTRLHSQPEDTSGEPHKNKELKISASGNFNKCENSLDEPLVECRQEPRNRELHHAFGTVASEISGPVSESNTDTSSVRKGRFSQHSGSTKRVQRRRSVAVLGLRTPLRRRSANFEVKSTSKLNGSTTSSKIPQPRGSKNCTKPKTSLTVTNNSSLYPQISDSTVLPDNEGQEEDSLLQKNVSKDVSLKVDASTNKSFNYVSAKHEDMKILDDIENLLKEQEEINIKACLLQEKIAARRLHMKEKKLMESFMTSISPLKRLKQIISKNLVEDGYGLQENPQQCSTEGDDTVCEGNAQGPHVSDKSEMNWENPKAAPAISEHQTHWRRQQNKRLIRTSQDSTPENEEFLDPRQGSSSPFTTLVGNCERPSLAPMTPHSRHHVSQLKKSLRKQLEQLYDK